MMPRVVWEKGSVRQWCAGSCAWGSRVGAMHSLHLVGEARERSDAPDDAMTPMMLLPQLPYSRPPKTSPWLVSSTDNFNLWIQERKFMCRIDKRLSHQAL